MSHSALFWLLRRSKRRWSSTGWTCTTKIQLMFPAQIKTWASKNTETLVNLHHVGVPPVRVFLGQRRQDPCACIDRAACIISHRGTPRHILFLLIIIGLQLLLCDERGKRLGSYSSGRQVALHRSYIMTGRRMHPALLSTQTLGFFF